LVEMQTSQSELFTLTTWWKITRVRKAQARRQQFNLGWAFHLYSSCIVCYTFL
jgi:hypothetical protein